MLKLLGTVTANDDEENGKRIQAKILGFSDDVQEDAVPWAYPHEEYSIVPEIDDKVVIYVNQLSDSEGYDFSRQYYKRFTEETYLELYDLENSESYKIKNDNKVTDGSIVKEPDPIKDTTYPENKVVKIGGVTVEHDIGAGRYTVTNADGSYFQFSSENTVIKSMTDRFDIVKGVFNLYASDNINIEMASGKTLSLTNSDSGMQAQMDELWDKMTSLLDEVLNLQTTGSPVLHTVAPASQATLNQLKADLNVSKSDVQKLIKD